MSTRLTERGTPMVDSHALRLVTVTSALNDTIARALANALQAQGFAGATAASLGFLSALECGTNHAAEIARQLGVSRQMVSKSVKEMCALGYLEQRPGSGRQKEILFTARGEQLIAAARHELAAMDRDLLTKWDPSALNGLLDALEQTAQTLQGGEEK